MLYAITNRLLAEKLRSNEARWQRISAWLLIIAPVQFLVCMLIEESLWPGYNPIHNWISDLGAPPNDLGKFTHGTPYWWIFSCSLLVVALFLLLSLPGLWPVLRERTAGKIVALNLTLIGVGSAGVAIFNEIFYLHEHVVSAAIAFIDGALALIFFGIFASKDRRFGKFAAPCLIGGCICIISTLLMIAPNYFGYKPDWLASFWPGGWERLIVAPPFIWAFVLGLRLVKGVPIEEESGPKTLLIDKKEEVTEYNKQTTSTKPSMNNY